MSYTIYKRMTPDGKVYIGCTSLSLNARAGIMGKRYQTCPSFWAAIQTYGWDTIVSTVLATADSVTEARKLEEYYIKAYDSTNPDNGYNISEVSSFAATPDLRATISKTTAQAMTAAVRDRLSKAIKESKEFRAAVISPEHRLRCSESARKRFSSLEARQQMSEAVKTSAKFQAAINDPDYRKRHHAGVTSVECQRKKSEAIKGRIHIHKDGVGKSIFPEELTSYLADGWVQGQCRKKK